MIVLGIFAVVIILVVLSILSLRKDMVFPVFFIYIGYMVLIVYFIHIERDTYWLIRIGLIIAPFLFTLNEYLKGKRKSDVISGLIVAIIWAGFLIWRLATGAGFPIIG